MRFLAVAFGNIFFPTTIKRGGAPSPVLLLFIKSAFDIDIQKLPASRRASPPIIGAGRFYYTVSFFLPFLLLLFKTFLPPGVFVLF